MTDWIADPAIQAAALEGWLSNPVAQQLERATVKLMCVTQPQDKADVMAEVARRTEIMGQLHAYLSVYDDVVKGRWPR